jgi:hypothetical protein
MATTRLGPGIMKVIRPCTGRLVGVAILAACASPSWAQTPPPSSPAPSQPPPAPATAVSPLTVEGASRATLQKQTQAFVESYAQPTRKLGLLARWTSPACVAVTGLVPAQAAEFKTKIEAVAKAVMAPVGGPKCAPNVQIVFTQQPQRTLDAATSRNPAIRGDDGAKTVTRPIQAWYATYDLGFEAQSAGPMDDGPPPPDGAHMAAHVTQERFAVNQGALFARPCVDPGARTRKITLKGGKTVDVPCPQSTLLNVLIIVDVAHMGDVSVDLAADYLALVALSQPKPRSLDGCLALPSVLDLYAKECPGREAPAGLTGPDKAYLASLYAADLAQVQNDTQGQAKDIAGRMVKSLTSAK